MKKLRFLALILMIFASGLLFSACTEKKNILCEDITLSENNISLQLGETMEIGVEISPDKATNKLFELVGEYDDVAGIVCDYENMKLIVTARDIITAGKTDAIVGVRTIDGSDKETHLEITLVEENLTVETPQNLTFDGDKLVWKEVDDARGYTLSINGNTFVVYQNSFALDLNDYAGKSVTAKVKSNGVSSNFDSEYTEELNFNILERPVGIDYNSNTNSISWNVVKDAISYFVYINDRPFLASTNSFSIANYLSEAGQYQIRVRANGDENENNANSPFSNSIILTKLSAPQNVNMQNGVAIWETVVGASGYEIEYQYSQDGDILTAVERVSSVKFTLPTDLEQGTYSLKIRAIGNGSTTISSEYGAQRNFTKLAKVKNLRVEDGYVVWDANNLATSYTILFSNIVLEDGTNLTDTVSQISGEQIKYSISQYPAGEYKIDILANGLDDKISSDKTGRPISVVKLSSPKNLSISKESGASVLNWDNVSNAKGYQIMVNGNEQDLITISANSDEIMSYVFDAEVLKIGNNIINIKAISDLKSGNVWYINGEFSQDLVVTKLSAPTVSMNDILNGNIVWTQSYSQGFESYDIVVANLSGNVIYTQTLTQNKINLNGTSAGYNLPVGDYKVQIKVNAKVNSNYYDSDYSAEVLLHKFDIETIKVEDGNIYDLEVEEDANYSYRYILNNTNIVSSINQYVNSAMQSGEKASVVVQKIPNQEFVEGIYYLPSNYSNEIYIQKLPTLQKIYIENGVLYFGSEYKNITGYKFMMSINDEEYFDKLTYTNHDFSNVEAGEYKVKFKAVSIQQGDGIQSSELSPLNINSYEMNSTYNFKKLSAPTELQIRAIVSEEEKNIGYLFSSFIIAGSTSSGTLKWNSVEGATEYELNFDNGARVIKTTKTSLSLQEIDFATGAHNVSIRAIGNQKNIITSDYALNESNEILKLNFTKLTAPTSLIVEDGKLKWSYDNPSDDPNNGIKSIINLSNNDLYVDGSKISVYMLVDSYGNVYSAIDLSMFDFDSGSMTISQFNQFIEKLKANECEIPKSLQGTISLRVFAMPINTYISSYSAGTVLCRASSANYRYVSSDYSPVLNIEKLETPKNVDINDRKISWSGLRYNVEKQENEKPLNAYEITIAKDKTEYKFLVKEDSTKEYFVDAESKILWIDDLSNTNNCYWNFTKENFEYMFGEGTYTTGVYSVQIKAIANNVTGTYDNGLSFYYCDSFVSTSFDVLVLENPVLYVSNGVVCWNAIENVSSYKLYINKQQNGNSFVEIDKDSTSFVLDADYEAGEYYFNIQSVGNDSTVFTAEFDEENEKKFEKLGAITKLYVENGVIKYFENSANSGKNFTYTMYVRNEHLDEKQDKLTNNSQYLSFELGDDFVGGQKYYVRVRVSGDNTIYLNSEISSYCLATNGSLPTKLTSPNQVLVVDGKLSWTPVDYVSAYKITLSGQENLVGTIIEGTAIENTFDISNITAGKYSVQIKGIGDSIYLNSSSTSKTDVIKYSDIQEVSIQNGYLTWKYDKNSNYIVVVNGNEIAINIEENGNAVVENGKVKYMLDIYESGQYSVCIYNFGGQTGISSAKTPIYTLNKLSIPQNIKIENELFKFDAVANATKYNVQITKQYTSRETVEVKEFETNIIAIKDVLGETSNDIKSYKIKVMAVGTAEQNQSISNCYISSNYSDEFVVTTPNAPVIEVVLTENNKFSGKIVWDAVENADYYKVFVKYYDSVDGIENPSKANVFGQANNVEGEYKVEGRTYLNVVYAGYYEIEVMSCQNKDGYNSGKSNKLQVAYNLFAENNNGDTVPYQITTKEQFNAMKYNKQAKYILQNDMQFADNDLVLIGNVDDMFVGQFDGNNKNISLTISSSNKTLSSLFGYIGTNGIVKNLNLNCNITSTLSDVDNNIYVAGIAQFNYGTISNVVVTGTVSTEYNFASATIFNAGIVAVNYGKVEYVLSKANVLPKNNLNIVYAGGIATINYGTIEKSGFVGIAKGQIVGGIAGQNIKKSNSLAKITECYYQIDSTLQTQIESRNSGSVSNYAGGIVGYMEGGEISYCYTNGKITGSSSSTNSNINANIGGIVGYAKNSKESIKNCYVVGYDSNGLLIDGTGTYVNVGVIIGDNNVDASYGNIYCLLDSSNGQSIIGNTSHYFDNAQSVSNIRTYLNKLGSSYFENDTVTNYLKLKNANYD